MKKVIVAIFAFMISFVGLSQEKVYINFYIVITFQYNRTNDNHPEKDYYWILPVDSIKLVKKFNFFPLYFDEFSNQDLKECQEQKSVNVFTMYKGEDFVLEKSLSNNINTLKELIQFNKKRVQTIVKKWNAGFTEKITVSVTPISGNFCFSNIAEYSGNQINYKGIICLPISNFELNIDFFKTKEGKLVEEHDYLSNIFFNK